MSRHAHPSLYRLWPLLLLFSMALLGSCGSDRAENERLTAERDSLARAFEASRSELDSLTYFFNEVSTCIDSVAAQEKLLFVSTDPETGQPYSRQQIRERVSQFKELLERQRRRISELSARLNQRSDSTAAGELSKLNSIIDMLNRQLDGKESQINHLQAELASSRASVGRLMGRVNSLETDVRNLEETRQSMGEALVAQSNVINEGFVKIGTKKQLKAAGILSGGGFLRSTRLNTAAFGSAGFSTVDIRAFSHIEFPAKKAKILTSMPAGSYRLEQSGKGTWTLNVTNASAFWSVSNYLVIQTD